MVLPTAKTGHTDDGNDPSRERKVPLPVRWALGAGAGLFGESVLSHQHTALGIVFVIGDVAVPAVLALTVLAAILFSSDSKCERTFRLLRWIADKPEPPNPSPSGRGMISRDLR